MTIQIILTGTEGGYYSKFKALHDRVLWHTCRINFRWSHDVVLSYYIAI